MPDLPRTVPDLLFLFDEETGQLATEGKAVRARIHIKTDLLKLVNFDPQDYQHSWYF